MKKPVLAVRPYRHHPKFKFILDLRAYGKGRMFFKTRAKADAECLRQKTTLERHGREAIGLQQREMSDFIIAKRKLAEYGKSINDAVAFLIDQLERVRRCNVTVAELSKEVIEAKRRDGHSLRHISDLKLRLGRFCQDFGSQPIAAITVEGLDNWLRALPYSPQSRVNFRAILSVLFSYAKKRRIIDHNPVENIDKPKLPSNPPEIFTVDELRALLEAASRVASDVLPMLAIGAFVGLRDAEIKRLDWSEVNLQRGYIEVTAAKAKSAQRRIVPIQPNLAAWLLPYSAMKGRLVPKGYRGKLDRVRKAAGLTHWSNNGLRHSFASYRLAATNNAATVAAELGHESSRMLYSTYRELVHPEEAERYWKIAPVAETENVVAFSNQA